MTGASHRRLAPRSWLRLPRRTARLRLTVLYGGLFLLSGVALVGVTYGLFERATEYKAPHLPTIPRTPAIQHLQIPPAPANSPTPAGESLVIQHAYALSQAQQELVQAQHELVKERPRLVLGLPGQLARIQHQVTQAQRQLAQDQRQLTSAVHQLAQVGPVQATQRAADSHELLVDSGIALAIVAVLALLAGWLVAGRMLRPIRTITRKAQRISSTNLHERLALDGPQDELKELGDTLDELFARLDAAFEAQRQFVANASHELRAPLTRQRAQIQVALADPDASFASLRAAHERVLASERHLEQMIDGLLARTRGQAGLERRERLDLASLAAQVLRARDPETTSLGLDVRATLAPAPAAGDPRLLERLLANLIDNAIRHNVAQGHVEIATGTRGQDAFLTVANSGPTIPAEEVPRLLEPFQRLHGTRTTHGGGNGLGLAIVGAIAAAHRAKLSVRPRPGGGLTVELALPATGLDAGQVAVRTPRPALRAGA
ncbi:MAG TPA: HAMP domain-containing sensor histidine kinase [Solirubrobacteraceae bacterium]|jgi:signal transduction histidine kinase|nr:HAMP domain-containing sensor histidine kinase [Solirubrobacteraceae bacterium]